MLKASRYSAIFLLDKDTVFILLEFEKQTAGCSSCRWARPCDRATTAGDGGHGTDRIERLTTQYSSQWRFSSRPSSTPYYILQIFNILFSNGPKKLWLCLYVPTCVSPLSHMFVLIISRAFSLPHSSLIGFWHLIANTFLWLAGRFLSVYLLDVLTSSKQTSFASDGNCSYLNFVFSLNLLNCFLIIIPPKNGSILILLAVLS